MQPVERRWERGVDGKRGGLWRPSRRQQGHTMPGRQRQRQRQRQRSTQPAPQAGPGRYLLLLSFPACLPPCLCSDAVARAVKE